MNAHVVESSSGGQPALRPRKSPRKSVATILRAAYRRFAGDPVTRRAVKLSLPVPR